MRYVINTNNRIVHTGTAMQIPSLPPEQVPVGGTRVFPVEVDWMVATSVKVVKKILPLGVVGLVIGTWVVEILVVKASV